MKKFYLLCGVVTVISCIVFWNQFFVTRPVIADPQSAEIIDIIHVYDTQHGGYVNITEYDETAILDYLSTCSEIRTLHRSKMGYSYNDFTVILRVVDQHDFKHVLLGTGDNYSYTGYSKFDYEIEDAATVLENLKELLEL